MNKNQSVTKSAFYSTNSCQRFPLSIPLQWWKAGSAGPCGTAVELVWVEFLWEGSDLVSDQFCFRNAAERCTLDCSEISICFCGGLRSGEKTLDRLPTREAAPLTAMAFLPISHSRMQSSVLQHGAAGEVELCSLHDCLKMTLLD